MVWKRKNASLTENSITEGVIWKNLLIFFFPILLGTLFQQMYNTADALIVGRFIGKEALAAVGGPASTIINLIVGFFIGLSSGATVILSQYFGARKDQEASQTVHTAMALAIVGGLVVMSIGLLLSRPLLELLGTPEEIIDYSVTYLSIYFAGLVPSLIYNIGSGLLRAVGDSRRPLLFLIAACVTNVVLDIVFVVGFKMHVAGAALATILSQFVSAVLVVLSLMRSHGSYRLQLRKIRFHGKILASIVRIGLPAGLQHSMYALSNTIVQTGVNAFGTDVVAAYTAFGKLDAMLWMVMGAFGVSITTFVGQNFGAQKYERIKRGARVCLGMTAVGAITVSVLMLTLGKTLFGLFTTDPRVLEFGMVIIHISAPCYVVYSFVEIFSGTMRGVGETLRPTLFTLCGICLLRITWILLVLPQNRTLSTLVLCYPVTWTATAILFIIYYFRGGWMKRAIRKAELR